MQTQNLNRVRSDVRKNIEPYLAKLLEIHKDNVISILLYGSATGKFYVPKQSDINLIIVLKDLEFSQLSSSLKVINQGIPKKINAPLFLSLTHIETSKDVFPVEFLEIKENNILLYGKDLFKDMQIDQSHIRLFCEREIKGKLLRLRQAYLEVGLRKKGIEALMKESMYALMPIFRALIRIKGQTPSVDKEKILTEVSSLYSLEASVFLAILNDKMNDEKIQGQDVVVFFEKFLEQIKSLALAVDKL